MVCRLALTFLATSRALFEDQAGRVDWCRQHVGKVSHAQFLSAGQQRLALVATESGVVAGVDLRTGAVAWRSVLTAGQSVALLQPHGKMLLSVSTSIAGAFVRLWGAPLGGLAWDAHIPRVMAARGAALPPDAIITGGIVFVCWQSVVRAIHLGNGELLWEWAADEGVRTSLLRCERALHTLETRRSLDPILQREGRPPPRKRPPLCGPGTGFEVSVESATAPCRRR